MIDCVVGAHLLERRLVMKVLPLAARRQMRFGQQGDRFASPIAAFLAATHAALGGLERALGRALPARREDAGAIGEGSERLDPKVYAGLLPGLRQGPHRHIGAGTAMVRNTGES
jgi:hypothetical protein